MTDRELLESAARAIGLRAEFNLANACQLFDGDKYVCFWNPLTDDGDAFRLSMKLHIDLCINNGVVEAIWIDEQLSETHSIEVGCDEAFEGMEAKYAAGRRAITSAAAQMSKAMGK